MSRPVRDSTSVFDLKTGDADIHVAKEKRQIVYQVNAVS